MNPETDAYRRHLLDQLAQIDQLHRKAAEPVLKRLMEIEALQPPPPIFIDVLSLPPDQRKHIGDIIERSLKK